MIKLIFIKQYLIPVYNFILSILYIYSSGILVKYFFSTSYFNCFHIYKTNKKLPYQLWILMIS